MNRDGERSSPRVCLIVILGLTVVLWLLTVWLIGLLWGGGASGRGS